jgi:hypothetical protein
MISEEEEIPRPAAVTVIGWIWLVLAVLSFLRSVVNLVVWNVIEPVVPSPLGAGAGPLPQSGFLRPLFEHFTAVQTILAVASIVVGFSAYALLRLRRWARILIQGVCWLGLGYVTVFACFWLVFWSKVFGRASFGAPSPSAQTHRLLLLFAGLAGSIVIGAGFAAMIALLRSRRVRAAFAPLPAR